MGEPAATGGPAHRAVPAAKAGVGTRGGTARQGAQVPHQGPQPIRRERQQPED